MSDNKELETLLKNLQKGLSKFTLKELNEAVVLMMKNKQDKKEEIEYVLNMVAGEYSIPVRTLKTSSQRGKIQDAKQITYCLLHFNLGLSIRHIAKRVFMTEWHNSITPGITRLKRVNPDVKIDREFKAKYDLLSQKLIQYLTSQTNGN